MINIWTQNRMKTTIKSYITINCIIVMFFCYINLNNFNAMSTYLYYKHH